MNYMIAPGVMHKVICPDLINNLVAKEFGVEPDSLKRLRRHQVIVKPRQVSMYFIRKYTTLTNRFIGAYYGRNHATCFHASKTVDDLIDTRDYQYYIIIERIRSIIDHNITQEIWKQTG